MVKDFVETLEADTANARVHVIKAQEELKLRLERRAESVLDEDLSKQIKSIKQSQGWQQRGAEKMSFVDKMLMLGMMDYRPSEDMVHIKSLLQHIEEEEEPPRPLRRGHHK